MGSTFTTFVRMVESAWTKLPRVVGEKCGPGGITIAATTSVKAMLAPGCPTGVAREVAGTVGIMSARISPYFTWHDLCKCKVRL